MDDSALVHRCQTFEERLEGVCDLFFRKLMLDAGSRSLAYLIREGGLLFGVEDSLLEGRSSEEMGVTERWTVCWGGVEISEDLPAIFVDEQYLLGFVLDEGERFGVKEFHLFLFNIYYDNANSAAASITFDSCLFCYIVQATDILEK